MTARLRKAFHYPDDSDHDHVPDPDEQEQEQIINSLRRQHDTGNAKYTSIFSVLPLVSTSLFLPSLLALSSSLFVRFLGLCGIASLIATAHTMWVFGFVVPSSRSTPPIRMESRRVSPWSSPETTRSLFPANAGVCAFLVLVYFLVEPASAGLALGLGPGLYLLPAVMLATILLTQKVMTSVDPSLLEGLRYEYKGA